MMRITAGPEATERLASRVSHWLRPGDVLCLIGGLGSGKTTFVRGLARGLKVKAPVQSPTFQLMRFYPGQWPKQQGPVTLVHVDWFRLSPAECATLMAEDAIPSPAVYLIEWADRGKDSWPREHLEVAFEWLSEDRRRLSFVGRGARWSHEAYRV